MGAVLKVDLVDLSRSLRLNTACHLELAHAFGRRMVDRGTGGILLVSSLAGRQGTPYAGNYAGSKAYILNLGMAMNYELRGSGVSVTVLVPGPTKTPGLSSQPDIPLSELPAPQMEPSRVAEIAVEALLRRKPYVIPGGMNAIMANLSRLLGPTLARNMWGVLIRAIQRKPWRTRSIV